MADSGHRRARRRRRGKDQEMNRAWCCSLGVVLQSHEILTRRHDCNPGPPVNPRKTVSASSFQSSPSSSAKMSLGFMDPRRMLSPGRVSPIDSISTVDPPPPTTGAPPGSLSSPSSSSAVEPCYGVSTLTLKGKDGRVLFVEVDQAVLCRESKFFSAMAAAGDRRWGSEVSQRSRKIEVLEVDNVAAFKDVLELMMCREDRIKFIAKCGVSRAIDMLEVAAVIKFKEGVASCLSYLEAVPWSEDEEHRIKVLFSRHVINDPAVNDILGRIFGQPPDLGAKLVRAVVHAKSGPNRKKMQALVSGLVSSSSVYVKRPCGLTKAALLEACELCMASLAAELRRGRAEGVSREAENLVWLFELTVDQQLGEEFVERWAGQEELRRLWEASSPMARFELSRVSGAVFCAIGAARVRCSGGTRRAALRAWLRPMVTDFGWMRRRRRAGGELRAVEECTGRAILTLPLPEQEALFMEWLGSYAELGVECPDLSGAFQVWWRRSLVAAERRRASQ
ncbi:PRLI-interacting factor [Wolffia australiana]